MARTRPAQEAPQNPPKGKKRNAKGHVVKTVAVVKTDQQPQEPVGTVEAQPQESVEILEPPAQGPVEVVEPPIATLPEIKDEEPKAKPGRRSKRTKLDPVVEQKLPEITTARTRGQAKKQKADAVVEQSVPENTKEVVENAKAVVKPEPPKTTKAAVKPKPSKNTRAAAKQKIPTNTETSAEQSVPPSTATNVAETSAAATKQATHAQKLDNDVALSCRNCFLNLGKCHRSDPEADCQLCTKKKIRCETDHPKDGQLFTIKMEDGEEIRWSSGKLPPIYRGKKRKPEDETEIYGDFEEGRSCPPKRVKIVIKNKSPAEEGDKEEEEEEAEEAVEEVEEVAPPAKKPRGRPAAKKPAAGGKGGRGKKAPKPKKIIGPKAPKVLPRPWEVPYEGLVDEESKPEGLQTLRFSEPMVPIFYRAAPAPEPVEQFDFYLGQKVMPEWEQTFWHHLQENFLSSRKYVSLGPAEQGAVKGLFKLQYLAWKSR